MKAIITGINGTIGSVLRQRLESQGHTVVGWNRRDTAIDHYQTMEDFLRAESPDVVFHLAIASRPTGRENESWLVNYEWSSELAWITRVLNITFIFTSTAMVFSNDARGPFKLDSVPDAGEGYGFEKRMAEQRVFYQNPQTRVVRLGWQIGEKSGSNNMIDYLERNNRENGQVSASTRWLPACSFLPDTAEGLQRLATMDPGLYMLDANRKWNFFEIASALNARHGNPWKIVPSDDFVYDQRMIDPRLEIPSLQTHLPDLKD